MTTSGVPELSTDIYKGLLESAPDAIVVVDSEGIIQLVNRQTETLFGYAREEMLGRPIEMLVPQRVAAHHPGYRGRYFSEPGTRPMGAGLQLTARRKDGTEFPVDISLAPLQTDKGVLVSAAVRDITERKRAEAKFQGLLESAPDAIVVVDAHGVIRLVNRQTEALFGYARDELVGEPVEMLVPRRIVERHPEFRGRYFSEPGARPMGAGLDLMARRKDGTEFAVDISLSPLESEEGTLVSAAVRDITELRRRAAEALGQSEERFRLLVEGVQDYAIFMVGPDGRVASWNAGAQRIFGYASDEIIGAHLEVLYPEEDRARASAELAIARAEGRFEEEGWRVRKDGSRFLANVLLTALHDADGVLRGFAKITRDITERRRAEDERRLLETRLQQSQRLESLGQLAGGVAHDFNNLLAAILNYADLIIDEPGDHDRLMSDIGEIKRAAERAAALTHQLLIFGRRELVRPEVVILNEVVVPLVNLLSRTIGEHVELRSFLADDLWPIKADPSGVEQVLMNLIVNARDAMPSGGILTIETRNVDIEDDLARQLSQLPHGSYVRLTVTDTGTGMTPAVAARVFEPFFTTKPKGAGSGLGLATVYGIVTQAGGDVTIYSEVGIGTTMRVFWPTTQETPMQDKGAAPAAPVEAQGETILLVEDEDLVREPTRRTLTRLGYTVLTASDGLKAIKAAAEYDGPIHLVLTDVVMPQMSGKELAEELARVRPGTRVLFMSGYPQDVLDEGMAAGMPLLEKPFSAKQLVEAVRASLDAPGR